MLHQIDLASIGLDSHSIIPTVTLREGMPFDLGVFIDGKGYRFQVKSTQSISSNGRMTFSTCKDNGKSYTDKDIDFFLLYCVKPEWYGLALLSECKKTTYIYDHPTKRGHSYQADQFDFQLRFRELAETGTIQPIEHTTKKMKIPKEPEPAAGYFKKPATYVELFNILAEYNYILDDIATAKGVSVPTLERWIQEFTQLPS